MADRTVAVKTAIIAALRADAAVGALVGDRIYDRPLDGVTFPHVRVETAAAEPFDAQSMRGWEMVLTINAFSREFGTLEADQIKAAIYDALHFQDLSLGSGSQVYARVSGSRTYTDPDGITSIGSLSLLTVTDG